jgi:hypothetical protein
MALKLSALRAGYNLPLRNIRGRVYIMIVVRLEYLDKLK